MSKRVNVVLTAWSTLMFIPLASVSRTFSPVMFSVGVAAGVAVVPTLNVYVPDTLWMVALVLLAFSVPFIVSVFPLPTEIFPLAVAMFTVPLS